MNKKYFRLSLFVTLLFFLLAGFSGCDNLTSIFTKNSKSKAYISLNVASVSNGESITYFDSESRTALPTFTRESIKSFKFSLLYTTAATPPESGWDSLISFEEEGDSADNLAAMEQASIPIAPGTYYFKISANKGGTCLEGISERMTIGGGNNPISINLVWDDNHLPEADPGSLTFTLDFSKASNADDVAYATTELQGDTSTGEVEADITGNKVVLTASDLKAGNYQMIIRLYGDTEKKNLITVWPESAIITGGQESSGSHELTSLNELYTITWHNHNATGVSCSETFPQKYTRFTAEYTLPDSTKISRTGYDFEGWFTDEECTQSAGTKISQGSTGPKDFYAKWTARTDTPYVVKHWFQILDKGTAHNATNFELLSESTENLTGTTDQPVTIQLKNTSSDTYKAYSTPSSTEQAAARATTIAPDGTTIINLYYPRKECDVLYYSIAGQDPVIHETYQYGHTFTVTNRKLTRSGYVFGDWARREEPTSSDQVFSNVPHDGSISTITIDSTNIKFFARWLCRVSFDTKRGSTIESQFVFPGESATRPSTVPTKDGCSFDDWVDGPNSATKYKFDNNPITSNTTIYASWVTTAYAKINDGTNDTYYSSFDETMSALSNFPTESNITITIYSLCSPGELGSTNTGGDSTILQRLVKRNDSSVPLFSTVNFIIDKDAGLVYQGSSLDSLFSGFGNAVLIDLSGMVTEGITSVAQMFKGCNSLQTVILPDNFDTSSATTFDGMFRYDQYLTTVNLEVLNTSSAENIGFMFSGCSSLTTLDLSNFDTSTGQLTDTSYLFEGCSSLTTIIASSLFSFNKVSNSEQMFNGCTSLKGGAGTLFDSKNPVDATFAKIDGGDKNPGYFTNYKDTEFVLIDGTMEGNKNSPIRLNSSTAIPFDQSTGKGSKIFIDNRLIYAGNIYACTHEVTQGEFETYCWYGSTEYEPTEALGKGANYPVYNVSWYEAIVYCNLRSSAEGLKPVYLVGGNSNPKNWPGVQMVSINGQQKYVVDPAVPATEWIVTADTSDPEIIMAVNSGFRLPTQDEWEFLARGTDLGQNTQYRYSGSDTLAEVAWGAGFDGGAVSGNKSHPVKTKAPNTIGLYDMTGNVYEWCWDWALPLGNDDYTYGIMPVGLPEPYQSNYIRVLRSSSYLDDSPAEEHLLGNSYQSASPTAHDPTFGFRIVKNAH